MEEIKELFQNRTKYSEKEYNMFLLSYQKEYGKSNLFYTIFYIVFFLVCIITSIKLNKILLAVALTICFVIYIWYKFIKIPKNLEEEKHSIKIRQEYTNTFKFYNRYFSIANPNGKANIYYFKIYKVIETKTHFYIYISRDSALILSKHGFIDCRSEDFRTFIKKHAMFKYKRQN